MRSKSIKIFLSMCFVVVSLLSFFYLKLEYKKINSTSEVVKKTAIDEVKENEVLFELTLIKEVSRKILDVVVFKE